MMCHDVGKRWTLANGLKSYTKNNSFNQFCFIKTGMPSIYPPMLLCERRCPFLLFPKNTEERACVCVGACVSILPKVPKAHLASLFQTVKLIWQNSSRCCL